MNKLRLEAFSDGVLAIVITLLILELKVPQELTINSLLHIWPVYLAYLIAFVSVFMSWLNHHNIFSSINTINHNVIWANGFYLLTVSHIPFVTELAGESRWSQPLPVILFGVVMIFVSIAFIWLRRSAAKLAKVDESSSQNLHESKIGIGIIIAYLIAIILAWFTPNLALIIYIIIPITRLLTSSSYRKIG